MQENRSSNSWALFAALKYLTTIISAFNSALHEDSRRVWRERPCSFAVLSFACDVVGSYSQQAVQEKHGLCSDLQPFPLRTKVTVICQQSSPSMGTLEVQSLPYSQDTCLFLQVLIVGHWWFWSPWLILGRLLLLCVSLALPSCFLCPLSPQLCGSISTEYNLWERFTDIFSAQV